MAQTNPHIKRVALLGAESTGKTTLARALALRFNTVWVPEYAREYMSLHPGEYTADDVEDIAREQLRNEDELAVRARGLLITDTEFITSAVWCEDVFGYCPKWISEKITEHRYDLYLLTSNDLAWVPDPVRVNSQRRDYFYNWYKRLLEQNNLPHEIIKGRYEARLMCAITAIRKHFGPLI
ncbi:MAG: ATP-binding protein [Bacteroidia bacterium]|jgi:NadR type nicotinamide-nucleotide adenylyltransferase|nr:ATP-binding protein [Bacteroidia bacterium]